MKTGKLTKIIDSYKYPEESPRDYIGASSIGSDCLRQIWYEFKGVKGESVPNKMKRTWDIGKALEIMVIKLLEDSGVKVSLAQNEFVHPNIPYFKGHCDGVLLDFNALLEIKTAKDSSFNLFVKHGCKKWNERYYAQLQAYMGMSSIHNAYIIVLNKDNSDIFDELITFDVDYFNDLSDLARTIYSSTIAPPKVNNSPLWFQCKMCRFNKVCHT